MWDWTDELSESFVLRSVKHMVDAEVGEIHALLLGTDRSDWHVSLDKETVTLRLFRHSHDTATLTESDCFQIQDMTEREPWDLLIGRELRFRWRMQNSMGYFDGLCLSDSFADTPRVMLLATGGIDLLVPTLVLSRQWTPRPDVLELDQE
ncbi:hypothetical protein AY599_28240 [Leptolyngbya valderiana BDU 20041]|nr:hypothetical protein AY599_28240 [Leptolyngbya valderiana BDU 20041]